MGAILFLCAQAADNIIVSYVRTMLLIDNAVDVSRSLK